MRENRSSGLMRGGVRRSLALCLFNPSAPPTLHRRGKVHCDGGRKPSRGSALGKPDAGKPPVRFDEGRSQTVIGLCLSIRRLRLLYLAVTMQ